MNHKPRLRRTTAHAGRRQASPPNKAYGNYTGSAPLLITDKDGLLYYISGNDSSTMSRVTAYGSQTKTKPDGIVALDSLFTDSTGKVWYVKSGSTLSIQVTGTTGLNPNQVPGMPMLSSSRYFYTDSTGTLKNKSIASGNPTSPGLDGLPSGLLMPASSIYIAGKDGRIRIVDLE